MTEAAWTRAVEMLDAVGIDNAAVRARAYPHEFSGGMCQRVMLAIAMVCKPKLLIADEPTTALDVTVQAQMLELMREVQQQFDVSILFITHDLGVVAQMCDSVSQIALQAPDRFQFRMAFAGLLRDVGLGFRVESNTADDGKRERDR